MPVSNFMSSGLFVYKSLIPVIVVQMYMGEGHALNPRKPVRGHTLNKEWHSFPCFSQLNFYFFYKEQVMEMKINFTKTKLY